MQNTFRLTIASVGETHFDGPAVSATFPGMAGEFTVLAHHEPLVTTLKDGTVIIRLPREESGKNAKEFSIENGILECSNNRVTVLL